MSYTVYSRRIQGKTHIRHHTPCQDYHQILQTEDKLILLVADGHGGSCYVRSGLGARFVCKAASKLLSSGTPPEEFPRRLKEDFDRMVAKHLSFRPLTKWEASRLNGLPPVAVYGTTFLAVVLMPDACRCYQLGDGEIHLMREDGSFFPALPDDEDCVRNTTSSMIYPYQEAVSHIRVGCYDEPAAAAFLFTDGYQHRGSRPYEVLPLLRAPLQSGCSLQEVLHRGEHGDDQTFVLACHAAAVGSERFQAGLDRTLHSGAVERQRERLEAEQAELTTYMTLALQKCRKLQQRGAVQELAAFREVVLPRLQRYNAVTAELNALDSGEPLPFEE